MDYKVLLLGLHDDDEGKDDDDDENRSRGNSCSLQKKGLKKLVVENERCRSRNAHFLQ